MAVSKNKFEYSTRKRQVVKKYLAGTQNYGYLRANSFVVRENEGGAQPHALLLVAENARMENL